MPNTVQLSPVLPLSKSGRRYGRRYDKHDTRDWGLDTAPVFRMGVNQLPPTCGLQQWAGPIKDQGQEGSCTGHAYSSIRELLARKYESKSPVLSPQYLYVRELMAESTFPEDNGAMPRTGCTILDEYGCCEESAYPYQAGRYQLPTSDQDTNAKQWIGGAYHRISALPDVLSCIASGYPCSVGFTVYESFEGNWSTPGMMPMPKSDESVLGGHEVFALGYDIPNRVVLIQNSWGTGWGLEESPGRFWMPFDFIKNPDYVSDLWLCHLGRAWLPKPVPHVGW